MSEASNHWQSNYAFFVAFAVGLVLALTDLLLKLVFVSTLNAGGVWGIPVANSILTLLHLGVIVFSIAYLFTRQVRGWNYRLIVVAITVSLSNLYDRLEFGGVRDYANLLGVWFNLADLVITIVIVAVIILWFKESKELRKKYE